MQRARRVASVPQWFGTAAFAVALIAPALQAQGVTPPRTIDEVIAAEGYLRPPEAIARVVSAPRHLNVALNGISPDHRYFVHMVGNGMPKLADFARPHHNLAGFQVDPAAHRARSLTSRGSVGISLVSWRDGKTITVQTPPNAKVSSAQWSPDGSRLAFLAHTIDATHLYVADPATGRSQQVTRTPVLATHVTTFEWLADGEHVSLVLVPLDSKGPPPEPAVAPTPKVRQTTPNGGTRTRMFFSVLETPWDMQLLEYFSTGQLARINVRTRAVTPVGKPAMIQSVDASPDGQYFRVSLLRKPFSYIVQTSSFGSVDQLWDQGGNEVLAFSERRLNLPAGIRLTGAPAGGARGGAGAGAAPGATAADTAKRSLVWRPDGPGFTFIQRVPGSANVAGAAAQTAGGGRGGRGGGGGRGAGGRGAGGGGASGGPDRVVHWLPPFSDASAQVVYTNDNPISSVRYSNDGRTLFITEATSGGQHLFAVSLDAPQSKHTIARGGAAGALETMSGSRGEIVARTTPDGQNIFLAGGAGGGGRGGGGGDDPDPAPDAAAAPQAAVRPFLDKVNIRTGARTRIFEAATGDAFEQVTDILNPDGTELLVSRESRTLPANFFARTVAGGAERKLTNNIDHNPELQRLETRTHTVTRVDGFKFRARVYLPSDYRAGTAYPSMFWIYPREYTSQADYDASLGGAGGGGGRGGGTNRFSTIGVGSIRLLTLQGYVVVEPDIPIVGVEGRMNDNYIPDLRNGLAAVIDEMVRLGYIDRERIGLGGHSYGATSTMNAMVNTPFFKAGIAGDGNVNRTMTPTGFQTESRQMWEDRDLYFEVSSLLWADRMNGALLLYHGQLDQNIGANPLHSERMFHALNSLGKTASLYMYPYEDHGQATEETRLDMWARWVAWLDKYVKNAKASPGASNNAPDGS